MVDWRKQGHAIRRRQGAPTSHLSSTRPLSLMEQYQAESEAELKRQRNAIGGRDAFRQVPDAAIYPGDK